MSELAKTAKYSAIYAAGVLISRAVSFIMLPIYTRFLTPEDYGTIELLTMTVDVFAMIAGVGLTAAVFRFYYKYDNIDERNRVISTITLLLITLYFLASSIGILFSDYIAGLILTPNEECSFYVKLIFCSFFFMSFIEIPLIFIKAQQKPILFVVVSVLKLILQLSLNIYFVVILQMHVLGVLYSSLIMSAVVGIFLIIYTFKTVGFTFSRKMAGTLLAFGAPFIFSNIGDFILTFSDRYFLKAYTDLSCVGIYSLGYKLGFLLWIFPIVPIMNIWGPQRFDIAEKPDAREINYRFFFFFNAIVISCALGISIFSFDLFRIMSAPEFWDAYKVVPLIMLAYVIQAWTSFGNFGVLYAGKTKYIAYGTVVAAVAVIILSFILIPTYGIYGAGIATIIAFLIRFIIIYYYSQKSFRLFLPWGKTVLMMSLGTAFYIMSFYFKQDKILYSLTLNTLFYIMYFGSILVFPFFEKEEKKIIFNLICHPLATLRSGGVPSD